MKSAWQTLQFGDIFDDYPVCSFLHVAAEGERESRCFVLQLPNLGARCVVLINTRQAVFEQRALDVMPRRFVLIADIHLAQRLVHVAIERKGGTDLRDPLRHGLGGVADRLVWVNAV